MFEVAFEVAFEVESMKWPTRQNLSSTKLRCPCLGRTARIERLLEAVSVDVKELRAVAIEYAWSKPHRLEAVEGVTIGRTWSVR